MGSQHATDGSYDKHLIERYAVVRLLLRLDGPVDVGVIAKRLGMTSAEAASALSRAKSEGEAVEDGRGLWTATPKGRSSVESSPELEQLFGRGAARDG